MPARTLLNARYGGTAPVAIDAVPDTILGQLAHCSIRSFAADPLPDGVLETLIAAAQSAATSSNLQQWSVIAIESQAGRETVWELCNRQQAILDAPLFLAWFADLSRIDTLAARSQTETPVLDYFDSFVEGIVDVTLAAQNAVIALEALGLGSVFIGSLRNHPEAIAKAFNLPPRAAPVFGLCVGYPSQIDATTIKPRLPQDVVLHRETYGSAGRDVGDAAQVLDQAIRDYQDREGRPATGWLAPALARVASVARLNGRDRMRESLNRLGFELR